MIDYETFKPFADTVKNWLIDLDKRSTSLELRLIILTAIGCFNLAATLLLIVWAVSA